MTSHLVHHHGAETVLDGVDSHDARTRAPRPVSAIDEMATGCALPFVAPGNVLFASRSQAG